MKRLLTLLFLRLGTGAICGMLIADAIKTRDLVGIALFFLGVYLGCRFL